MKVKLTMLDRLFLCHGILPVEGTYATMTVSDQINEKVKFTDKEVKDHEIVEGAGSISVNKNKDKSKNFDLTEEETKHIADSLRELDKAGKLRVPQLNLYKTFHLYIIVDKPLKTAV